MRTNRHIVDFDQLCYNATAVFAKLGRTHALKIACSEVNGHGELVVWGCCFDVGFESGVAKRWRIGVCVDREDEDSGSVARFEIRRKRDEEDGLLGAFGLGDLEIMRLWRGNGSLPCRIRWEGLRGAGWLRASWS